MRTVFSSVLIMNILLNASAVRAEKPFWSAGTGTTAQNEPVTSIGSVLEDPDSFKDKAITVEGRFRGWKGKCASSFTQTRSDWMLEDETGCLYVSGRIPDRVSPAKPQGELVRIRGQVITKEGKAALKMVSVSRKELPDTQKTGER